MEVTYSGIPIYLAVEFERVFKMRYQGPGNEKGLAGMYFSDGRYKRNFYTYSKIRRMLKEKRNEKKGI